MKLTFLESVIDDIRDVQREECCDAEAAADVLINQESDPRTKDLLKLATAMALTIIWLRHGESDD